MFIRNRSIDTQKQIDTVDELTGTVLYIDYVIFT